MKRIIFILILLVSCVVFLSSGQLELVDTWKHDFSFFQEISHSIVDQYNNLLLASFLGKKGVLINKKKATSLSSPGEGPDEVTAFWGLINYQDDIAIFERGDKLKVFQYIDDSYVFKEIIWLRKPFFQSIVKNALYSKGHFYLAGTDFFEINEKNKILKLALASQYDEKSREYKNSFYHHSKKTPDRQYELMPQLICVNGLVYLIKENELNLYPLVEEGSIEKTIDLTEPPFYRKMPLEAYSFKQYSGDNRAYLRDLVEWKLSYSSISKAVVYDAKYLLIQIRTANADIKKFALLVYDVFDDFKLLKVLFTDDLLLGEREGLLYCYENGDPALDEAEHLTINLYRLDMEK